MTAHRRSRPAEITAGLMSLLVLAAVIAGLPAALYAVAGSPVPHDLPSWHQAAAALTRRDTGALFLAALRDVAWAAWAAFTVSALVETGCLLRGRSAPRLAGIGGMQHAARALIAAVVVAFSSAGSGLPVVVFPAAAATAAAAATIHDTAAPGPVVLDAAHHSIREGEGLVTVHDGGDLWDIAGRHLGDPERWREIWQLNRGRIMPGGIPFTDPAYVLPGFELRMPAGAAGAQNLPVTGSTAAHGHPPDGQPPAGDPAPAPPGPAATGGAPAGPPAATPQQAVPAASVTALPHAAAGGLEVPVAQAAVFALGMLAGGALTTVRQMRHRQRQQRGRGRRIALPASREARRTEHELREAAARSLPGVLRGALAALADSLIGSGEPVPGIAGVHLTPAALEILLTEPARSPPGPFRVRPGTQDMCWVLEARSWATLPAVNGTGRGDLLPGLVTAGVTSDGGYLLADLEAMGVTTVDGQPDLVDRVVASAGVELATNPWAGAFDLVLAGFAEMAGVGGRAQACSSLDEAIGILAVRARQLRETPPGSTVRDRRLADPACPDWTLTLLVSRIWPEPSQMTQLLDAAIPGCGIAALIAGDVTAPDGREAPASLDLHEDPRRPGLIQASLHPLGILLTAQALDPERQAAVSEIFQAAASRDAGPGDPPYGTAGLADWSPAEPPAAAGADSDSGNGHHPGRAVPGTAEDAGLLLPSAAPDAAHLRITILGPFQITGGAADLQPKHAELVLALALAGGTGLSNSALRTILGTDEDTPKTSDSLRQIITRTRRELGRTAAGGEYILHVGNSQYVLDQSAWLDWHAFRGLAEEGRASRDRGTLWDALTLVRGRPLDGVYHWWVETALIETIRAEIVDAADLLAELELGQGDPAAARRAARTALAADRAAEQLWRAVMRAEDSSGNSAGVHQAWRECLEAIADIAADGEPHEDTTALYSQLTRRHAAHAST